MRKEVKMTFEEYLIEKFELDSDIADIISQSIINHYYLFSYIDGFRCKYTNSENVYLDTFLFENKIKKTELSDWIYKEFLEWRNS